MPYLEMGSTNTPLNSSIAPKPRARTLRSFASPSTWPMQDAPLLSSLGLRAKQRAQAGPGTWQCAGYRTVLKTSPSNQILFVLYCQHHPLGKGALPPQHTCSAPVDPCTADRLLTGALQQELHPQRGMASWQLSVAQPAEVRDHSAPTYKYCRASGTPSMSRSSIKNRTCAALRRQDIAGPQQSSSGACQARAAALAAAAWFTYLQKLGGVWHLFASLALACADGP